MTEQEKLMKNLAMEESLRKSRAMIIRTSDRKRFVLPKGRMKKISVKKTYAARLFPRREQQKHKPV